MLNQIFWLRGSDLDRRLERFFNPSLTAHEREVAAIEGWILGDLGMTGADARQRRNPIKTTRPRGGAITVWYKGKTCLPVWRQISADICRYPHWPIPESGTVTVGVSRLRKLPSCSVWIDLSRRQTWLSPCSILPACFPEPQSRR